MRYFLTFLLTCFFLSHAGAQLSGPITLSTPTGNIQGTLDMPASKGKVPVVLFIAGSGPTDRDGNNMYMVNNSLKGLADSLTLRGIACVRYDKRGIAASKGAAASESGLRFDHYVSDVQDWIRLLHQDNRFNRIVVLGHSEGSLIGMLAVAREKADGYISVAGMAEPADQIIMQQLEESKQLPKALLDSCRLLFGLIKSGQQIDSVPRHLMSIFRPSVQPYLASWIKYNPQEELPKVTIPTLLIQGTHDIQVSVKQGELLAKAKPDARLVLVEDMNHIFRKAPAERDQNIATYSRADLPIEPKLVSAVASFVKKGK